MDHEAKTPIDIELTPPPTPVAMMPLGSKPVIHPHVIVKLSEIVLHAKENDGEFRDPSPDYADFSI